METIRIYLENMFINLPRTAEMERLKGELLATMEEKYHALKEEGKPEHEVVGIVISEFGNIDEILEEMNIERGINTVVQPIMKMEEVREYIALKQQANKIVAFGVALILFGVSVMFFVYQTVESGNLFPQLISDTREAIPVVTFFFFLVPAVAMFVYAGNKLEHFKYVDEGGFDITSMTASTLTSEYKVISAKSGFGVIVGVCLCVFSPVPLFISSLFGDDASVYGLCALMLIVTLGVWVLIHASGSVEAYKKLLKRDEFKPEVQKQNKVIGAVASVVWPLAVCVFLVLGFVYDLWEINWLVFVVTGILFGSFCAFYNATHAQARS